MTGGRGGGGGGLTCSASVATRHVEAILRMRGVGVRIPRDLDTSGRRLVGLSEMEAALKGALVLWGGREEEQKPGLIDCHWVCGRLFQPFHVVTRLYLCPR